MARALWSGAISFGLINVPVKMYRATASSSGGKQVSFHQIHKTCGTRIKHLRWCPTDEKEVPWDEVAKGYEYEKGKYVLVGDEEIAGLPAEEKAAIGIEDFVMLAEVDPIFFEQAYWVAPEGNPRAYALLLQALASSGKVAIARVLLRTKTHLAVVRAAGDHLMLETMFYADEVVDAKEIPGAPSRAAAKVNEREEKLALQLIESMTVKFDPSKYEDVRGKALKKLVEEKIDKREGVTSAPTGKGGEGGRVIDLMDALQRSLSGGEQHPARAARAGGKSKRATGTKRRAGATSKRRRAS